MAPLLAAAAPPEAILSALRRESVVEDLDELVEECAERFPRDLPFGASLTASKTAGETAGARRGPLGGGDAGPRKESPTRILAAYRETVQASAELGAGGRRPVYNFCSGCGVEMTMQHATSELVCYFCGETRVLVGTAFDDAQFYGQEGQKTKSGTFSPNRHFRFWFERILARESELELEESAETTEQDRPSESIDAISTPPTIPTATLPKPGSIAMLPDSGSIAGAQTDASVVALCREIVRRERRVLRHLTPGDIRDILQLIGRTDLNKNTSLLLLKLTGVGPPDLPPELCSRAERIFVQALDVSRKVRSSRKGEGRSRANRNYYPYYIYKILDAIIPAEDRENRRVLYYIYLQSDCTLEKNDEEWREICAALPGIPWRKTDPTEAARYRPS